ncbi:MAG: tRNA (adenosine(37)-N6)-threonylcarbamoyltransferase complex ATPase subunit type 1 TsaE, partial [Alphaproteobacteria bacterium]
EDAFVDAVCLVEWPERLGPWLPRSALRITLEPDPSVPERRVARLSGSARWQQQLGKLVAEMG